MNQLIQVEVRDDEWHVYFPVGREARMPIVMSAFQGQWLLQDTAFRSAVTQLAFALVSYVGIQPVDFRGCDFYLPDMMAIQVPGEHALPKYVNIQPVTAANGYITIQSANGILAGVIQHIIDLSQFETYVRNLIIFNPNGEIISHLTFRANLIDFANHGYGMRAIEPAIGGDSPPYRIEDIAMHLEPLFDPEVIEDQMII